MKQKFFILLFSAVVLISLLCIYLCKEHRPAHPAAEIYVDGQLFRTVSMQDLTVPEDIVIDQNGKTNIVRITRDSVCMTEADCPDQLCVRQGAIQNSLLPIVCLPNRITVRITGDHPSNTADLVSR